MIRAARKILSGAFLTAVAGTAAIALPSTPHEQAEVFATCAGRFAAIATHQKAQRMPEARESAEIHDNFELLLDATLPEAMELGVPEKLPIQWHSGGWKEIARLLADAEYSVDASRAETALEAVEQRLQDCRGLIFG